MTSWVLIVGVCLLSCMPLLGFGAWLIAAPVLFVTLILGIVVIAKGGTLQGVSILLISLIGAPIFVAIAPFVGSFLGLGAVAVASQEERHAAAKSSPPNTVDPSQISSPAPKRERVETKKETAFLFGKSGTSKASDCVEDNAGLFSQDALNRATVIIHEIKGTHDRDVRIETHATLKGMPAGKDQSAERNKFATDYIANRGRELSLRGLMVLIVVDPPHIQSYVGKTTTEMVNPSDQNELMRPLGRSLADKQYDKALLDLSRFIQDRMRRNSAGRNGNPIGEDRAKGG